MATVPKPYIYVYKEINEGKYKTVKHYQLQGLTVLKNPITDKINISKDRNFANSKPDYWLKLKEGNKWGKPITGLFKTSIPFVYRGDHLNRKHLILVHFAKEGKALKIYYFRNYFTGKLESIFRNLNLYK